MVAEMRNLSIPQNLKPVADSTSAMGFRFLKGFCLNPELVQIGQNLGLLIPNGPADFDIRDAFP